MWKSQSMNNLYVLSSLINDLSHWKKRRRSSGTFSLVVNQLEALKTFCLSKCVFFYPSASWDWAGWGVWRGRGRWHLAWQPPGWRLSPSSSSAPPPCTSWQAEVEGQHEPRRVPKDDGNKTESQGISCVLFNFSRSWRHHIYILMSNIIIMFKISNSSQPALTISWLVGYSTVIWGFIHNWLCYETTKQDECLFTPTIQS